jgi:hypothetical protein
MSLTKIVLYDDKKIILKNMLMIDYINPKCE